MMTGGSERAIWIQLDERIAALDIGHGARLAADLDSLRRLAAANGLTAMTPVIHAIEAALGRGERGPAVASGVAMLRDAVRCGDDPRANAALAAACARRIAG